jgi:hypothetical protein
MQQTQALLVHLSQGALFALFHISGKNRIGELSKHPDEDPD